MSFWCDYLCEHPVSKWSHIPSFWGLGLLNILEWHISTRKSPARKEALRSVTDATQMNSSPSISHSLDTECLQCRHCSRTQGYCRERSIPTPVEVTFTWRMVFGRSCSFVLFFFSPVRNQWGNCLLSNNRTGCLSKWVPLTKECKPSGWLAVCRGCCRGNLSAEQVLVLKWLRSHSDVEMVGLHRWTCSEKILRAQYLTFFCLSFRGTNKMFSQLSA